LRCAGATNNVVVNKARGHTPAGKIGRCMVEIVIRRLLASGVAAAQALYIRIFR
jgi:hypothetical protein